MERLKNLINNKKNQVILLLTMLCTLGIPSEWVIRVRP